ncbi:MAG: sigma-54 dependent transcriptional regulator [Candidatus Cloacimonetes bacterium]|nr:sigma-54 dependent transcriptional regulator [Candidatus Cloacimonadota bacterium]
MNILLVDDDEAIRHSLGGFIRRSGRSVTACADGREALRELEKRDYPLVITDIYMPHVDGMELLREIRQRTPLTLVVLITGHGDVKNAVEAMSLGAYDYLLKPVDVRELSVLLDRIEEYLELRHTNRRLTEQFDDEVKRATQPLRTRLKELSATYSQQLGRQDVGIFSETMRNVFDMAARLHRNPQIPVLLTGETGTGKEVVARAIHYGKESVSTPFVAINCAALTPELFGTEIFGYVGGAFTGASPEGNPGKIELAGSGTLLLDEIGELGHEVQAKLLRLLQEREFYRVGGDRRLTTEARIICATNQDIDQRVANGNFREDLYHRLAVGRVHIPPLRDRREEILPLADFFLKTLQRQRRTGLESISKEARNVLTGYHWPGNVRELQHILERCSLLFDDDVLRASRLRQVLGAPAPATPVRQSSSDGLDLSLSLQPGFDLHAWIHRVVLRALEQNGGNKSQAAKALNITRSELYTLLKQMEHAGPQL